MKRSYSGLRHFFKKHTCRYINGTKGVISLFLAILMVPFVSIAAALINAARVNSAVAIFDEALCNASNSTLGTYDKFLKQRFGLLAMDQNTASGGSGYTADDLIADTFQYYMEKNVNVLQNTYFDLQLSASGVYPLTDPDVLLMEVMEYGKYSVPAKLIVDGFSLDDILNKLLKANDLIGNLMDFGSSSAGVVDKYDKLEESLKKARDELESCQTLQEQYGLSYNVFAADVQDYNATVTERNAKVAACEAEIAAAQSALASADEESRSAASARLAAAQQELQETIAHYQEILAPKRAKVEGDRKEYAGIIEELSEQVLKAGETTVSAQNAFNAVIDAGTKLTNDIVNVATTGAENMSKSELKDVEEKKKELLSGGAANDDPAVVELDRQISALKAESVHAGNIGTVNKTMVDGYGESQKEAEEFVNEDYRGKFADLYTKTIELKNGIDGYTVSQSDETPCPETGPYFIPFTLPITKDDLETLEQNMAEELAESGFLSTIKAMLSFFKALFGLKAFYDSDLCANIDNGKFLSSGGLPSTRGPSSAPSFLEDDKKQSDYYKNVIGSYSSSAFTDGSVNEFEAIMEKISEDIDTIESNAENLIGLKFFSKIGKMIAALADIFYQISRFMTKIADIIAKGVYAKLLLTGYVGYNTANRTTFSGSALTGSSFDLPSEDSDGYCFFGAETEYILCGNTSELENQKGAFLWVYGFRLLFNLIYVTVNSQVMQIAQAAAAATMGIGGALVLGLYYLLEPLADTIILVNGGDVPIVKSTIYLTPSGIVELIGKISKLKLTEGGKQVVYDKVLKLYNNALGDGNKLTAEDLKDFEYAGTQAPSQSSGEGESGGGLLNSLSLNYTKMMILILIFMDSETMLKRLGDIIQMEASYKARYGIIDVHDFDLGKSYTYLRASGSFTTNEFIRLSEEDGINSTTRVVYRGY